MKRTTSCYSLLEIDKTAQETVFSIEDLVERFLFHLFGEEYQKVQKELILLRGVNRTFYSTISKTITFCGNHHRNTDQCLRSLPSLTACHLNIRKFQNETLKIIAPGLRSLKLLMNCPFKCKRLYCSEFFQYLTNLTTLKIFNETIWSCKCTIQAKDFLYLTKLTKFYASGNQIDDTCLKPLVNLTALTLGRDTRITGEAVMKLTNLQSLKLLHKDLAVTDEMFKYLTGLKHLKLGPIDDLISDSVLFNLPKLESLCLEKNKNISTNALLSLKKLIKLKLIGLNHIPFEAIASLPNLRSLVLEETTGSTSLLLPLSKCPLLSVKRNGKVWSHEELSVLRRHRGRRRIVENIQ